MKISLVICVWNTSHLLKRSIETYSKQDFPKDEWELIVIDDNSEDDVLEVITPFMDKINIVYKRLEHNYGMRGNTVAFNTGFSMAKGDILAETTPETMFTNDTITILHRLHLVEDRCFVAMKTHNMTNTLQENLDNANWREDISNIKLLPGFDNPWCHSNDATTHFGTHQTCSIKKSVFYEIYPNGFPLFCDYGCLSGETKVLTADLDWVRNDSLKVGDALVGFDEFQTKESKRKFRKAIILSIGDVLLPAYKIKTNGEEITASFNHKWLVRNASNIVWKETKDLKIGDKIKIVSKKWDTINNSETGYLAGLLDGEGSIDTSTGFRVDFTQNPGVILDKIIELYDKYGIRFHVKHRYNTPGEWGNSRKGMVNDVRTKDLISAMKLLGITKPIRFKDKWVGIGLPIGDSGDLYATVENLTYIGDAKLIGMKTSTNTFIAEGLASHNSEDPTYAGDRQRFRVKDITIMNPLLIHQWHAPFQYWMSKGKGPRLNKHAHTMENYMNDTSGRVPPGGTCMIWDRGSHEMLEEKDYYHWKELDAVVKATGCKLNLGK